MSFSEEHENKEYISISQGLSGIIKKGKEERMLKAHRKNKPFSLFLCAAAFNCALWCTTFLIPQSGHGAGTPIPAVSGPIPVTVDSHPFHTSRFDLAPFGYVEEEFFVSSEAHVYEWDASGGVGIRTPHAPYTTRILVWRPADPSDFSGDVIVELLNPTALFDIAIVWGDCHNHFMRRGDAYVGITSKPIAVKALKTFNPERYAPLSWANPLPPDETCPLGPLMRYDSSPETENGLIWDIVSQVGALLKSNVPEKPLTGFDIEHVYATGYSQTGMFLVTYINAIHALATLSNGDPVYDGYLVGANFGMAYPINQCSAFLRPNDPRNTIQPRNVPVIVVATQTDFSSFGRRPDSDDPGDRFRLYEVAGSAHASEYTLTDAGPTLQDIADAGIPLDMFDCVEQVSDFPLRYIVDGAFVNLGRWVESGTPPPRGRRIAGTSSLFTILDEFGNAVGGVRTPYVDVPIVAYYPSSTPVTPMDYFCALFGSMSPFGRELLQELYPTHWNYVGKVFRTTNGLLNDGWITEEDAWCIITDAWNAPIP